MMEFHKNNNADIAKKVFKLGVGQFGEDVEYISTYIDFLISLNDDTNARAAFEKAVSKLSPEVARPLWDRWASYEYQFSDSTAIQKLDARMAELYPESAWPLLPRNLPALTGSRSFEHRPSRPAARDLRPERCS